MSAKPPRYQLRDIAVDVAHTMGIGLVTPTPPVDLYDHLGQMGFAHVSPLLMEASTFLGPMNDNLTLVGERPGKGQHSTLLHCYSGRAEQTGLLYAQTSERVVLVTQGYPEGRVVVEAVDLTGSEATPQRLMPPYVMDGRMVVAENEDAIEQPDNLETLADALSLLLEDK